ncbi:NAD(P)/FAD-dependent oxidoreductase, partial [Vibrio parahaemolyticus]|nr:NAD(P)/FAD-dependent oxidoreductase [Vibrio parahaemolyticus]
RKEKGEILFTDYGVSGPPILQLSREAVRGISEKRNVQLEINLFDKSIDEFRNYLIKRFSYMPTKTIELGLIGLINKRLIIPILKEINLDKNKLVKELSKKDIDKLSHILTDWRFKVIGDKGWGQAQTTAGGILTQDINPETLESKKVNGLYFCGEILDVDGDCGGYNLQWA